MKQYIVVPFFTGCLSGHLDDKKLAETLNAHAQQGWKLTRTIHETRKGLIGREAHFLIFERDT